MLRIVEPKGLLACCWLLSLSHTHPSPQGRNEWAQGLKIWPLPRELASKSHITLKTPPQAGAFSLSPLHASLSISLSRGGQKIRPMARANSSSSSSLGKLSSLSPSSSFPQGPQMLLVGCGRERRRRWGEVSVCVV